MVILNECATALAYSTTVVTDCVRTWHPPTHTCKKKRRAKQAHMGGTCHANQRRSNPADKVIRRRLRPGIIANAGSYREKGKTIH
jgi:hypothetical protein